MRNPGPVKAQSLRKLKAGCREGERERGREGERERGREGERERGREGERERILKGVRWWICAKVCSQLPVARR